MIDVTDSAMSKIEEYFETREIVPVRVFLNSGG